MTERYDVWIKYEGDQKTAIVIPQHRADDMYIFIDMAHATDESVTYSRLCTLDDMLLQQINDQIRKKNFQLK